MFFIFLCRYNRNIFVTLYSEFSFHWQTLNYSSLSGETVVQYTSVSLKKSEVVNENILVYFQRCSVFL